ncbi:MAG: MFS transporter [Sphingomonadales bacterium]
MVKPPLADPIFINYTGHAPNPANPNSADVRLTKTRPIGDGLCRPIPGQYSGNKSGCDVIMWSAFDKTNRPGWLVVTGLLLVMIVVHGTITSALPTLDEALLAELGIPRADLKFRETIFLLSSGLSGLAIGFAIQRIPPRVIVIGGLVLLSFTLFLYSRAQSIGQLYGLYALLGPCFASAHVVIVLVLVRQYFARLRTLATSVALSGTSVGAAVLPGFTVFLNESLGWRGALDSLMLIPLAMIPVAAFMLFRPPPPAVADSAETGTEAGEKAKTQNSVNNRSAFNLTLLAVATFGVFFASTSFLLNLFLYMRDIGMSAQFAAAGISTVFAIGLVAKVLVGAAAERWGIHPVWISQKTILLIGAVLLTSAFPGTIFPALALLGLGWAGCFVLTQVVIAEYFAGPNLGKMVGVFIVFEAVSSGSGVWLAGFMHDVFGSYHEAFVLNCAMIVMALGAGILFRRSQKVMQPVPI